MGLYCILCGKNDKSVSYLRFPSNKHIRKQWLKFCKKREKNLYISHRLCTDHFKPEDLRKHLKCIVVQEKAVPCIYTKVQFLTVENGSKTNDDNISSIKTEQISDPKNDNINGSYLHPNICLTPLKRKENGHCSSKKKRLDFDSTELVSNDGIGISNCKTPPNNCVTELPTELVCNDSTISIQELPVSVLTPIICDSAPPMIPDPRYVGDIQLSHFATPRRATRAINVMRRIVTQQRQKIETLQKKCNRCKQRISSLKDLVLDLKKRNYISEAAADNLMGEIPQIMHEVLKRQGKVKNKYSAELRTFALTLNFYSSKAYEYVRKTFKNLLPQSSTIRKWYRSINGRLGFTEEILQAL